MPDYFLPYVESAESVDEVTSPFFDMDPPEPITVDELRDRIASQLVRFSSEVQRASDFGARVDLVNVYADALLEEVTLGNVPAKKDS